MKLRLTQAAAAFCAALSIILLFAGCHENAIINSHLTPAIDNIHTFGIGPDFNNGTDTITMRTKTVYVDSIVTSARLTGLPIYQALGWVNQDMFAGNTSAGIYMQFVQPYTGFTLGSYTLDSLVLVLPYSGFTWGDTTMLHSQKLNVYRINQSFSKDSVFYNFSSLSTDGALIASGSVVTGPAGSGAIGDSVSERVVNTSPSQNANTIPHLRIKLSDKNSNFQSFFQNTALTNVDSVNGFTTAFPGLAIMPDTTPGNDGYALPYFILNNSGGTYGTASILAYAHNTGTTGPADTVFQFPYSENSAAHFNRITRNYTGKPAAALLSSTADNSEIALMQNAPGAAIDLTLPFIQNLPKNVVINKAELVFTKIDTLSADKFFGPARLYPQGINSSGVYTVADAYPISDYTRAFLDGTPRIATRGGITVTEYRINIPREVQRAIVQGSDSLHLRIGGTVNFPGAYRTIVGGSGYGNKLFRPSINIIYSKQ